MKRAAALLPVSLTLLNPHGLDPSPTHSYGPLCPRFCNHTSTLSSLTQLFKSQWSTPSIQPHPSPGFCHSPRCQHLTSPGCSCPPQTLILRGRALFSLCPFIPSHTRGTLQLQTLLGSLTYIFLPGGAHHLPLNPLLLCSMLHKCHHHSLHVQARKPRTILESFTSAPSSLDFTLNVMGRLGSWTPRSDIT